MPEKQQKIRVCITLSSEAITMIKAAALRAPNRKSTSAIIEYCIKQQFRNPEKKIREKVTEHQNKADFWLNRLKEYEELKKDDPYLARKYVM